LVVQATERFDVTIHEQGTATAPGGIAMLRFQTS